MFLHRADCLNYRNNIGMGPVIVNSTQGITLAGGGPFGKAALARALVFAPVIVAADGGADRLLALGSQPTAVIGDFDSISPGARAALAGRLFPIAEQETTDFDKALRSIKAPFVLGLGFAGARLDHGLAVLNTLVRQPEKRCLIIGPKDLTFLSPRNLTLQLPVGTQVSLFPMGVVSGHSQGLRWPISGLHFSPDGRVGTSNEVASRPVHLQFDSDKMLVILPLRCLGAVLQSLGVGSSVHSK